MLPKKTLGKLGSLNTWACDNFSSISALVHLNSPLFSTICDGSHGGTKTLMNLLQMGGLPMKIIGFMNARRFRPLSNGLAYSELATTPYSQKNKSKKVIYGIHGSAIPINVAFLILKNLKYLT